MDSLITLAKNNYDLIVLLVGVLGVVISIFSVIYEISKRKKLPYSKFELWLDGALSRDITHDVVAFCFNLYQNSNSYWTIELIGANSFDANNNDWACDEVFSTRDYPLTWHQDAKWSKISPLVQRYIKRYMKQGKNKQTLMGRKAIAVGFVDGDLVLL